MAGHDDTHAGERGTVVAVVTDLLLRQKMVEGLAAAGYAARIASGPTRLRDALDAEPPTAILLDLEARSFDAVALIRDLRADPATHAVPILGFFGHTNLAVRDDALAAGCTRVATRGEMAMRLDRLMDRLLGGTPAA
ncbi:MAG: hypothetical protein AB1416_05000 [Actinomycetota bacterium]